jgi:assimilatory nitrate reductase catalytic subunit
MADGAGALGLKTTCPYCGVGCGVTGLVGEGRTLSVSGDQSHPANAGRLCSKGSALGATVGLEGRLLHPMIGDRQVGWPTAIAHVAKAFQRAIARHGPDSVAFYVSGQLLTEDYYVANKLMKGFIGSGNIDTNSRLCMASAVAAHKQAFGADLVPGCYEDLSLADLIVFSGHNAAWTHPVLFRRMEAAKARGQRHVVIDPRRTDTAETADLHLALSPQSDVRLWNGLLADLLRRGVVNRAYVEAHVSGFEAAVGALANADQSISTIAADCGLAAADVEIFYRLFAEHDRTVTLFSQGSNQSVQGVAKALAVINAHLATGRIGKPGACPFSITGQPNAMGGREAGGMANTLAAHMEFNPADVDRVRRFWSAPNMASQPGLKAVDMFEAVHDGRIKAIWIMATNPAVSMPNAARVRDALTKCPMVVVSDCMATSDTLAYADVKLPALAWGEKDGTVTNSERCISRQRPLFQAPGEARPDWRIVADVAQAMGFADDFNWRRPSDVFREHARLTQFENTARQLDLGPLAALSAEAYDQLLPVQWPIKADGQGQARLFTDGLYATPDGHARMIPVQAKAAAPTDPGFPLSLNTGRVRDHWHTLTRTGLAPDLCRHAPEPYVEIHPDDAEPLNIGDDTLTRVVTRHGEAVAIAKLSPRQRRGSLFMPMHWTDGYAPSGRANPLVGSAVDPQSGQPEFKHTPARIHAYRETWRGFFIARQPETAPSGTTLIWRRIPSDACHRHEFAGRGDAAERELVAKALSGSPHPARELINFEDRGTGALRRAAIVEGRLEWVLFLTTAARLPARDWLLGLFETERLSDHARLSLLAGRPLGALQAEAGPMVCACLKVGALTIGRAIAAGAGSVEAVGQVTGAGANCGSCRPEILALIGRKSLEIPLTPANAGVQIEGRYPRKVGAL